MILLWINPAIPEGRNLSEHMTSPLTALPLNLSPYEPHSGHKVSLPNGQPMLAPAEHWLAALLTKHLQTAWDLVSQTRLWLSVQGRQWPFILQTTKEVENQKERQWEL